MVVATVLEISNESDDKVGTAITSLSTSVLCIYLLYFYNFDYEKFCVGKTILFAHTQKNFN